MELMKKLLYESTTVFLYRIVIFFTFVSGFQSIQGLQFIFSGYGQSVRTFSMRQARFQRTVRQAFKHSVASQRLRNRVMTARLYYWREIMRRRLDDVMIILAENEFFVDERTINNAWLECADFFEWLCSTHATVRQLRRMFPSWKW